VVSWLLVGCWALWTAVRLLGLDSGFPLVAVMAFTPYVALTAFVPLAVAIAVRNSVAAIVAGLVLVLLGAAVLPRAFGGPTEAQGAAGPTLRLLAANTKLGKADPDALVALVRERDVDVLSVEELTSHLAGELDAAGLDELLPHRELATGSGAQGSGLYSRFELAHASATAPDRGFPLITAEPEIPGAVAVATSSVHTTPPTVATDAWARDLENLPSTGAGEPRVLLGDFNATLDQSEFRDLVGRGYADAADALGDGLTPTWPTNRRFPPLVTIDHVLADQRIGIRDYAVEDLPGSDHRAVVAELSLPAQ